MKTFEITMIERGADGNTHTLKQTARCEKAEDAIKWYGLNEPDIVGYTIKEI